MGVYTARIPASGWLQTSTPWEGGWSQFYAYRGSNRHALHREPDDPRNEIWTLPSGTWNNGPAEGGGVYESFFVGHRQQWEAVSVHHNLPFRPLNPRWSTGGRNLSKADMRGVQMRNAQLKGANLHHTDLRGADMRGADLRDALLSADLAGAVLRGANLSGADLISTTLERARLQGAILKDADLFEARLKGANFTGADLSGAHLEGADFTGATLTGANLRGATFDTGTRWPAGFEPERHGARVVRAQPGHECPRYLIPSGYVGWIRVDYGVREAPALPIDPDGYYVHKLPVSGWLKTSTPNYFRSPCEGYFYYSGDQLRPLDSTRAHWDDEHPPRQGHATRMLFIGTEKQYRQFRHVEQPGPVTGPLRKLDANG
jgi:hypothetical protein